MLYCNTGVLLSFNNRVLWTDFDTSTTSQLLTLLDRVESSTYFSESIVNKAMRFCIDDLGKSIGANVDHKCEYNSIDVNSRDKLMKIIKVCFYTYET